MQQPDEVALQSAPRRMQWMRERGTRKLVLGFVSFLVIWGIGGKVWDEYLLQKKWPALDADPTGLTVVGTLDSRAYDSNMFRILQANESTRVELTDRGWRDIFDGRGGPMFDDSTGTTIKSAIDVDSEAGYAMLAPFIRYGVRREMHGLRPGSEPNAALPISYDETTRTTVTHMTQSLGDLLRKYHPGGASGDQSDPDSGESENPHQVDHGLAIPAEVLIRTCPIVLNGKQFTHAELEVQPASILQGETYSVHLYLNSEGRSRFYQWSHEHEDEDVVFVLKDRVICAGRIKQTMDVSDWTVGPIRDKEAANALVEFVERK